MRVLLDTHVLLWWQGKSKKLSRRAAGEIKRADTLLVSAITCWEVATLLGQGRFALDRTIDEWLEDMEDDPRIELVPLGARAAVRALELAQAGFHGDPADRLIYATAAEHMVTLVSADERIRAFAETGHPPVRIVW